MNNDYQEFSCGFFPHSLNFRVSGLTNSNQGTAPIHEALKNLLERGYPTRPRHYLEDKIIELHSEFSWSDQDLPEAMMIRPRKPNWLKQYNHIWPHQALNMRPPVPETLLRNGT